MAQRFRSGRNVYCKTAGSCSGFSIYSRGTITNNKLMSGADCSIVGKNTCTLALRSLTHKALGFHGNTIAPIILLPV